MTIFSEFLMISFFPPLVKKMKMEKKKKNGHWRGGASYKIHVQYSTVHS